MPLFYICVSSTSGTSCSVQRENKYNSYRTMTRFASCALQIEVVFQDVIHSETDRNRNWAFEPIQWKPFVQSTESFCLKYSPNCFCNGRILYFSIPTPRAPTCKQTQHPQSWRKPTMLMWGPQLDVKVANTTRTLFACDAEQYPKDRLRTGPTTLRVHPLTTYR